MFNLLFAENERRRKDTKSGLPVSAVLYNEKTGKHYSTSNTRVTNGFNNYIFPKELKKLTHAERIVLNLAYLSEGTIDLSDWTLLVTSRPCNVCSRQLFNIFGIKKVYYLYGNDKKDKHKIKNYKSNGYDSSVTKFDLKLIIDASDVELLIRQMKNRMIKPWINYIYKKSK